MIKKIISPCISICKTDPVTGIVMVVQGLMKKKNYGRMKKQIIIGNQKT